MTDGCVNLGEDPNNCGSCDTYCGSDVCIGGVCQACPPGQTDCGVNGCSSLLDNNNCGSCGFSCNGVAGCGTDGMCHCSDPQNPDFCDGYCTNFYNDPYNCGGCASQGNGVNCTTPFDVGDGVYEACYVCSFPYCFDCCVPGTC